MNPRFLVCAGFLICAVLMAAPVPKKKDDAVNEAVQKGTKFLLNSKSPDGSFGEIGVRPAMGGGKYAPTALAMMALASVGHLPTDPTDEGKAIEKALDFLTRSDPQRGQFNYYGSDGSQMYGHGIVTLALTEMLGMGVSKTMDDRVRANCQEAVKLILKAQRVQKPPQFKGGWRYSPMDSSSDLSITVWQLMALRSAKNAGIDVPKTAIDDAVEYLKRSYPSARDATGRPMNLETGFTYVPGEAPRFSTASAGMLAMQVCNQSDAPEVIGTANYLNKLALKGDEQWFFYGIYYYSQAMQKRGGAQADKAKQLTEQLLIRLQGNDGAWTGKDSESHVGRVYSTSMAMLSLSVKYHFLPIYQH